MSTPARSTVSLRTPRAYSRRSAPKNNAANTINDAAATSTVAGMTPTITARDLGPLALRARTGSGLTAPATPRGTESENVRPSRDGSGHQRCEVTADHGSVTKNDPSCSGVRDQGRRRRLGVSAPSRSSYVYTQGPSYTPSRASAPSSRRVGQLRSICSPPRVMHGAHYTLAPRSATLVLRRHRRGRRS